MANDGLTVKIRITGVRETIRAFNEVPKDANNELRDGSMKLAQALAPKMAAAGRSQGAQAASVASSVKARRDRVPVVVAGGAKRVTKNRASAGALVAASEFGANGRYGWYALPWFRGARGRQYKPHRGAASYWFFRTAEENTGQIERAWTEMAERILEKWAS